MVTASAATSRRRRSISDRSQAPLRVVDPDRPGERNERGHADGNSFTIASFAAFTASRASPTAGRLER
jgi:hypothetical protein